jgi:hypothetical protein
MAGGWGILLQCCWLVHQLASRAAGCHKHIICCSVRHATCRHDLLVFCCPPACLYAIPVCLGTCLSFVVLAEPISRSNCHLRCCNYAAGRLRVCHLASLLLCAALTAAGVACWTHTTSTAQWSASCHRCDGTLLLVVFTMLYF